MPVSNVAEETCRVCGRSLAGRAQGEPDWRYARYCSDDCGRRRLTETDYRLEEAIEHLLAQRRQGGAICPSAAARFVDPLAWRSLMEPARMAARRMAAGARLEMLPDGRVVAPAPAPGTIRPSVESRPRNPPQRG